jgi:IS5 family transposase
MFIVIHTLRNMNMSICSSGIGEIIFGKKMVVTISDTHPLILLGNKLPWNDMHTMVLDDLKNSTPHKQWWRGRKLKVRIHLGAYILQQMNNLTDREVEASIKDKASYQIFCGHGIVDKWHCPDHTKIETFRSRLSPATQKNLANLMCKNAVDHNLASPDDIDVDSTIQEANMTYPTDAKMLRKLGNIASAVSKGIKGLLSTSKQKAVDLSVDIKTIASAAREYFFLPKTTSHEEKSNVLSRLWNLVSEPVTKVINACNEISEKAKATLRWNVRRAMKQLTDHGEKYLLSAKGFIETGKAEAGKRLSFHLNNVDCFNKNKPHKKYEFGRCFQLARITKNFIFVKQCDDVRMDDKQSFLSVIEEHEELFGTKKLNSVATDKGYYSNKNVKSLISRGIKKIGIQLPCNVKNKHIDISSEQKEILSNRRAGIEPLIGHIKQGGQLGRSRMKNDRSIESSGYASVMGFNLRQTLNALIVNENEGTTVF